MAYYKPLPEFVTLKTSEIHGLGLFSTKVIPESTEFGISHVKDERYPDGLIRTPLGGFINHSEFPNVERVDAGEYYIIKSLRYIAINEEITLKYSLYDPTPEVIYNSDLVEPQVCSIS